MPEQYVPAAEVPTGPVEVPAAVARIAGAAPVVPVWVNELGGLTFRVGRDRYVKWVAAGTRGLDLAAEAERLAWAAPFTSVPRVLASGADDAGSWLVTAALDGRSAVDPYWLARPVEAATAIGRGLRALHDALPVGSCPYAWSVRDRLGRALENLDAGDTPASWAPEHRAMTAAEARYRLTDPPDADVLVVCHADACAPNTLLADDGSVTGHVDLGRLGVADRWADLAVAAWSVDWNHGPGYDHHVYAGYGVEPDPERIAYYRLLWDAS
ncbi:aminoglycoside 3'-phosphotransferase [Cellulomonas shaoxiangyii]|uniref:Aminoglycoside 3'-phosphotransferase n=1 Tax=Cellulomonas shaoxiangyii TaxID=2566013 RepID=A0A4P7SLX7_9CELL|nr:aminoglycoside 3'-phosphotransferase [Cellulomonas shaoxiangyii]QCB94196.1 aminoglycoside 3'-phosphotransferase [Cellulomonas shaoxiangyii]TGY86689.1 aminoglycoside 3'-phosphotransferase [Cellulomonas shaoxiangyii]